MRFLSPLIGHVGKPCVVPGAPLLYVAAYNVKLGWVPAQLQCEETVSEVVDALLPPVPEALAEAASDHFGESHETIKVAFNGANCAAARSSLSQRIDRRLGQWLLLIEKLVQRA